MFFILLSGHCEKPICYVVDEIDPRNRHIYKRDCNHTDEIKLDKIIRYSCASDIHIGASKEIPEKFIFTFFAVNCNEPTTEIFIGTKFSDMGTSGNISFPLIDIPNKTFSLYPGSGETFEVPLTAVSSESELNQKVNTAVVIASDEEVVVYCHHRCHGSNNQRATAFRVRATVDLGTEYWVITHQSGGKSQVGVAATKDHTNISFNGVYINRTLNLNKYEIFYFGGSYDLAGTYIVADKPIFVIAGNSADTSPNPKTNHIDSFNKCLPPIKNWGRHFTLVPFPPQSQPFTAKILPSHDNCKLAYVDGTGSHNFGFIEQRRSKSFKFFNCTERKFIRGDPRSSIFKR
ncbi:hypothetical protein HOLleu_43605 [Holothuria leucospilota]|uniref:IgGFc-binding protein N-terminal domain-containing protein n=1 Tax=Holothuria leucospilota TaxID=206669 RepID=A0A9Q0YDL3_HOLLE|nr:hypothetical protein HOLleu_43605 [Holothuria leucospilota]